MKKKSSAPVSINLYVPEAAIRAIDRWLGWRVYRGEITLGEASRSSEIERVIKAEATRVKRFTGKHPAEALPRTEGDTVQINQRVPGELLEILDTYARAQQVEHGHSSGTFSRSKLIYAALMREGERLTAELEKAERAWLAEQTKE